MDADIVEVRPRCSGCEREIDPETCHCGAVSGECNNHDFRPMGCDCGRDDFDPSTRVDASAMVVGVDLGSHPDFSFLTEILTRHRSWLHSDVVYVDRTVAGVVRISSKNGGCASRSPFVVIDELVDFERAPRLGLPLCTPAARPPTDATTAWA